MKHLFIIEDGEVKANQVFVTERRRAEHLISLIEDDAIGDRSEFAALLDSQDMEALCADYPEGVSPSLPNPEDRLDDIKDWLAEQGIDIYLDVLDLP